MTDGHEPDITALLDDLVDCWCGRRALDPLRRLLPAYPPDRHDTHAWVAVREALRSIRAKGRHTLPEPEWQKVVEAAHLVDQLVDRLLAV